VIPTVTQLPGIIFHHPFETLELSVVYPTAVLTYETDVKSIPTLTFLGHSSVAINTDDALLIIDPVVMPGNVASGGDHRPLRQILRAADFIVISHHHWDHLHFQTLCTLPKDKCLIVPRVYKPRFSNPPIREHLTHLGLQNIIEAEVGQTLLLRDIELRFFLFFGEPFGLSSTFDGFTYHIRFAGRNLYGSVDSAFDENGDMEETITDAERWALRLKPRVLIPYAEFIFQGRPQPDLRLDRITSKSDKTFGDDNFPKGSKEAFMVRKYYILR
jgi:L-ascorbate metabolism protein UlaG (beta-lactamase superfamily)